MQGLLGAMLQADIPHCVPDALSRRGSWFRICLWQGAGGRGRRTSREAAQGARGPARRGDAVPDPAVKVRTHPEGSGGCALGDSPGLGRSWAPAGKLAVPTDRVFILLHQEACPPCHLPLTRLCLPQLGEHGSNIFRIVKSFKICPCSSFSPGSPCAIPPLPPSFCPMSCPGSRLRFLWPQARVSWVQEEGVGGTVWCGRGWTWVQMPGCE